LFISSSVTWRRQVCLTPLSFLTTCIAKENVSPAKWRTGSSLLLACSQEKLRVSKGVGDPGRVLLNSGPPQGGSTHTPTGSYFLLSFHQVGISHFQLSYLWVLVWGKKYGWIECYSFSQ
jgi:hypothetical protein